MARKHETTEQRFWKKVFVADPNQCWEWTASKDKFGYGWFWFDNKVAHATRYVAIYQMGIELLEDQVVCHTCDNPGCVNLNHLFVGLHVDNMRDMVEKGRWSSGNAKKTECKRGHKFTEENTRINPRGQRVCKACDRQIQNARYQKKRNL